MRRVQDETECNECIEDLGDNCVIVQGEAVVTRNEAEDAKFLDESADIAPSTVKTAVIPKKKKTTLKDLVSSVLLSKRFRALLSDF